MRVLGIDPGLQVSGYGLLETQGTRSRVVEAGVVRSEEGRPLAERLRRIYLAFRDIVRELRPDVIVVEELYSHYRHPTTAILMGHARGVMFLAAAEGDVAVVSYGATRIKKALTGNGHASKDQMQRMVQSSLRLATLPQPADVADALAVALCHANTLARGDLGPPRRSRRAGSKLPPALQARIAPRSAPTRVTPPGAPPPPRAPPPAPPPPPPRPPNPRTDSP